MPSADLDAAVETAVKARLINNGQSCIAAKRFIVHEPIYPEFERRFVGAHAPRGGGRPHGAEDGGGPAGHREHPPRGCTRRWRRAWPRGRGCCWAASCPRAPGYYYPPTVLADPPPGSPAAPRSCSARWPCSSGRGTWTHAIALANDSPFGLGASVWTRDEAEQRRFIDGIEAGMVFVNGMVASDPRLPFGGVKHSGHGRELALHGLREFLNIKTVRITAGTGAPPTQASANE